MKAVISIAARMASTRLPGKVMAEVAGKPIIQHLVERLSRANAEVVISNNGCDPEIRDLAHRLGAGYVGEPMDVVSIHFAAALRFNADILCIAGADDPLLDPAIFDLVIDRLHEGDVEYVKTAGWPLGMNVWGVTFTAMERAKLYAIAPDERQHVVPFWERRPNTYPQAVIRRAGADLYGRFRVTVDQAADLEVVRQVYAGVGAHNIAAENVIHYLTTHPHIAAINAAGLQGTAARDAIYPDLTPVDGPVAANSPGLYFVSDEALVDGPELNARVEAAMSDRFGIAPAETPMDAVRRQVQTERQAALAAVPERGAFAEGQAAAMLSMDQWLQYKGDL